VDIRKILTGFDSGIDERAEHTQTTGVIPMINTNTTNNIDNKSDTSITSGGEQLQKQGSKAEEQARPKAVRQALREKSNLIALTNYYDTLNQKVGDLFDFLGYPESKYAPDDMSQPHYDGQEGCLLFPSENLEEGFAVFIHAEKTALHFSGECGLINERAFLSMSPCECVELLKRTFPDINFYNHAA